MLSEADPDWKYCFCLHANETLNRLEHTPKLVVAAAEGYPASPRTGDVVVGLTAASRVEDVDLLCAGVADEDGSLVTAGGRVLNVVGRGPDVSTARARAYEALGHLSWPGMHHRTDIAAAVDAR
ncbi:MAG TPA: phosphoribosylglycinamide synthetase C domain-containing protein, partial [Acidimicrobiales bacterium]|nr:phosphoribosylglycinamide synthetase C domain-containing protein [Acidimicrobiales bacterium]